MRCGPRHGTWRPAMGGEHWPRLAGAGAAAACATNAECSRASCKTVTVWHDRTPTRFRPAGDDARSDPMTSARPAHTVCR